MAAPVRVPGGTGSPINPVAVFGGWLADAQPLEVLHRRAHLTGVPGRPVVAIRQPRHAGAAAHGDHPDRETFRTVLLAHGQEPLCQGDRRELVHIPVGAAGVGGAAYRNGGEYYTIGVSRT